MLEARHNNELPEIPAKRYFTIGEVSELCDVKAHVLRYWEQEFKQLSPVKRSGNRRFYQRADIELIRNIRHLLHMQGFTISGARQQLEAGIKVVLPTGEATGIMSQVDRNKMIIELERLQKLLAD